MDALHSELVALRAQDRAKVNALEREKNVLRKAELKHMIKNNITPPPQVPGPSALLQSAMETASAASGSSLPSLSNFPTFTPPSEENVTQFAGTVGFGSMSGFCAGYALKKAGRAAAVTVGVIFMALTAAEQKGYIDVRWDNVERDTIGRMDMNNDGKVDSTDAQMALKQFGTFMTEKNSAVTSGTFTAGLLYGLRKG